MVGNLTKEQIEKVISDNFMGRIGCHSNGKTYVVPVSYAYDGKCIYVHTYEGLKITMMRENPDVCFQVDRLENMANWESVIAMGKFEELTDTHERNYGLQKLTQRVLPYLSSETVKLSPQWPFPPDDLNKIKGIVFRICLYEKSGRYEGMEPQMK